MNQPAPTPASDREARYRALLFEHMAGQPESEIAFFLNPRRFAVLESLIGEQLTSAHRVLNVASGPFALEFYALKSHPELVCTDIDPSLVSLHTALVEEGLIPPCAFHHGDVMDFEGTKPFDLIIINDLFFHKGVDFFAVLTKYAALLRPGGQLYFDIQDDRAGALWRLVNNDARYRRYNLGDVRTALAELDFEILEETPSLGIKGGVDWLARAALWHGLGIANNVIFSTRRRAPQRQPAPSKSSARQLDFSSHSRLAR